MAKRLMILLIFFSKWGRQVLIKRFALAFWFLRRFALKILISLMAKRLMAKRLMGIFKNAEGLRLSASAFRLEGQGAFTLAQEVLEGRSAL